ncbi:unnamed protein product [Ceutorhynchus assimilis]|uniref:Thioredoxin domain-containing protein n=1 Tax=Ceutorhynchus assimilis TaxID=467358 RepID=A0A9N9QKT0_9CUCU|nr:unnamed protein product [Ceutorhynchus assimilis]
MNNLIARGLSKTLSSMGIRSVATSAIKRGSFKVQDEDDFVDKVQNSKEPVIVDFFAKWCGPCKALEPRLENIIAQRKGGISVAKVDIDDLGELAAKYEVSTIPALVVFHNGKVTERLVGLQDEDKLTLWIDNALKK